MSGDRVSTYYERLMEIARRNRVQVHFLSGQLFPELDWDGLYLVAPGDGAGIAIRNDLEPCWRDWVLAHELGHHFGKLLGTLFSPFRAHTVNAASRKRWGEWRRLDPDEERANAWAVKTLISPSAWEAAERASPCDLRQVVARLGLPLPAAVAWERQQRANVVRGESGAVQLSDDRWRTLERSLIGQGGHQAFFRRLAAGRKGSTLMLSFYDFSFARERVLSVRGGWLARYATILDAVGPLIERAGGVSAFFKCNAPQD